MSWNYRVFKTQYSVKLTRSKEHFLEQYFTLREIYYDEEGKITACSGGDCGVAPSGNTPDELWKDLQKMQLAFHKPVITPLDIMGYTYDEEEIPYGDEVPSSAEE